MVPGISFTGHCAQQKGGQVVQFKCNHGQFNDRYRGNGGRCVSEQMQLQRCWSRASFQPLTVFEVGGDG